MFRNYQNQLHKNVDASFKAAADTVRGSLVTKNYANGTFAVAASATADVYILDQEQIASGINVVYANTSDADAQYETVKEGTFGLLIKPQSGERFGTTEFVAAGFAVGDYAGIGLTTNAGKFVKSTDATKFKYVGTKVDNGKTLAVIEVL